MYGGAKFITLRIIHKQGLDLIEPAADIELAADFDSSSWIMNLDSFEI